mmetsp:Transcript_6054/g.11474  ORF Transcript_6054/g.11474 Transcript_6054/m.11474 type:complete len:94 (-) Transcript_6054:128-409(-)
MEEKARQEEAKAALEVTKNNLMEEETTLFGQLGNIKKVKDVDLFNAEGDPMNLRNNSEKYASDILHGNGVYSLVQVSVGEGDQLTQEPLDLSV